MMTRREHVLACLTFLGVPEFEYTLGAGKPEKHLRRALRAVIEGKVRWLRATHCCTTLDLGVFDWPFGIKANWHVVACNEHWGWECDEMEFFRAKHEATRRRWPGDLRALIYLELLKNAEQAIEAWRFEVPDDAR